MTEKMIHPCKCGENRITGQCYNCLNGAHAYCDECSKKRNSKHLGLKITIKNKRKDN